MKNNSTIIKAAQESAAPLLGIEHLDDTPNHRYLLTFRNGVKVECWIGTYYTIQGDKLGPIKLEVQPQIESGGYRPIRTIAKFEDGEWVKCHPKFWDSIVTITERKDQHIEMLQACLEQLKDYSENEWVIGGGHTFTIDEIQSQIDTLKTPLVDRFDEAVGIKL